MQEWEYGTEEEIAYDDQVLAAPIPAPTPYATPFSSPAPQTPPYQVNAFQPPTLPAPPPFQNPLDVLGTGVQQGWEAASGALGQVPGLAGLGQGIGDRLSKLGEGVQATLDYAGRPAGAVRSAVAELVSPQYGGDVGAAALAGLQGQSVHSPNFAGVLESAGMGTQQLGPVDTRGLLGFGLDLAADPVNLIPGGGIVRGARAADDVARLARSAGDAFTLPRNLSVIERSEELTRAPRAAQAVQWMAQENHGLLGKLTETAANLISPRILASGDPVGRARIAMSDAMSNFDNTIHGAMAPLEALGNPFNMDGTNIILSSGRRIPYQDFFSDYRPYLREMDEDMLNVTVAHRHIVRQMQDVLTQKRNDLRAVAPEVAANHDYPMSKLPAGWQYYPRMALDENDNPIPDFVRRRSLNGPVTHERQRDFLTTAAGEEAGKRYVDDPNLNTALYLRWAYREAAEMEFAQALVPVAKQANFTAINAAKVAYQTSREDSKGYNELSKHLNRVLRGEHIPPQSIAKFSDQFPQHTEALQLAIATGDPKQLATTVRIIDADTQRARDMSATYYRIMQGQKKIGKDITAGTGRQEVAGAGYLKGLWFTPDEATDLSNKLSAVAPPGVQGLKTFTDVSRTLQTGFDFSGGMIQGLPLLARFPDRWLKAQTEALKSAVMPNNLSRYLAKEENQYVLRKHRGVQISGEEYYSANQPGGPIERFAPGGLPVGKVVTATLRPSERAFTTFGTVARIEALKALDGTFERAGKSEQLADFVNHMTGAISMKGMGISDKQAVIEATFLSFAPRYTRAALALVGDMLTGGVKGQEAAQTLGSMMVVGNAMYQHIAAALGQEAIVNPKDGRFMTVEVNGQRVGVGTIWVSLARLAGKVSADPANAGDLADMTNPLVQFLRGRLPLIPGAILDSALNETIVGTPLQTLPDYVKYAASKAMPFWADTLLMDMGNASIGGTAAEMVGMRSFPQTFTDVREKQSTAQFGRKYDDLNPVERARVMTSDEMKKVPQPRGGRFEPQRQATAAHEQYGKELETLAAAVNSGTVTKDQFRERIKDIAASRNTRLSDIERGERKVSADPKESAYQTYLSFFKAKNELGQSDYDGAEAYFMAQDSSIQAFIREKQQAATEYLGPTAKPLMEDLRMAQRKLEPYWDIQNTVYASLGIYREWVDASPAEKERLKANPRFKRAQTIIDKRRDALRTRDPEIDRLLVEWHGNTPILAQRRGGSSFNGFRGFG